MFVGSQSEDEVSSSHMIRLGAKRSWSESKLWHWWHRSLTRYAYSRRSNKVNLGSQDRLEKGLYSMPCVPARMLVRPRILSDLNPNKDIQIFIGAPIRRMQIAAG